MTEYAKNTRLLNIDKLSKPFPSINTKSEEKPKQLPPMETKTEIDMINYTILDESNDNEDNVHTLFQVKGVLTKKYYYFLIKSGKNDDRTNYILHHFNKFFKNTLELNKISDDIDNELKNNIIKLIKPNYFKKEDFYYDENENNQQINELLEYINIKTQIKKYQNIINELSEKEQILYERLYSGEEEKLEKDNKEQKFVYYPSDFLKPTEPYKMDYFNTESKNLSYYSVATDDEESDKETETPNNKLLINSIMTNKLSLFVPLDDTEYFSVYYDDLNNKSFIVDDTSNIGYILKYLQKSMTLNYEIKYENTVHNETKNLSIKHKFSIDNTEETNIDLIYDTFDNKYSDELTLDKAITNFKNNKEIDLELKIIDYINNNFVINDKVEYKRHVSQIKKDIVLNVLNGKNEKLNKSFDIKLSNILTKKLNLSKKRLSDGIYYFGLKPKDNIPLKKEDMTQKYEEILKQRSMQIEKINNLNKNTKIQIIRNTIKKDKDIIKKHGI